MFRLVALTCVIAAVAAQNVDPKNAKIIKEQRFNAGDGRAGSAFATEDGVIFREEADADGNRIGQYSYIGDDGTTYTVRYSAGKDGFRILDGSHVPSDGQGAAAFNPDFTEDDEVLPAPVPKAAPLPARPAPRPVARPAPLPVQRAQPAIIEAADSDPNFNPFINPNDPTHLDFRFNKNAAKFAPDSPLAKQSSLVPNCADCAGVNPFVNPFDQSHRAGGQLAGHLAGHLAGVPQPAAPARAIPAPRPAPRRPAPRPAPLPQPQAFIPTTVTPKRFFPPGQLSLNRFETGFNFDFES